MLDRSGGLFKAVGRVRFLFDDTTLAGLPNFPKFKGALRVLNFVKAFADHVIAERGVRHRFATLSALFPVLRNGNAVFTCCGLTF